MYKYYIVKAMPLAGDWSRERGGYMEVKETGRDARKICVRTRAIGPTPSNLEHPINPPKYLKII